MTGIIRMKVKGIFVFLPLRATLKQFDLQTAFQTHAAIILKHSDAVQGEKKNTVKQQEHHPNSFCQVIIAKDCMEVSSSKLLLHYPQLIQFCKPPECRN